MQPTRNSVLATIDEYLNGNVTKAGLKSSLLELALEL